METLSDKQRDRWPPYCPLQSSFFLTVTPNIITSRPIGHSEPRDVQGDHILYFILFPLGLRACQFKGPHPFIGNQFVPHSGGVDSINEPIGRWRILKRIIKNTLQREEKKIVSFCNPQNCRCFFLDIAVHKLPRPRGSRVQLFQNGSVMQKRFHQNYFYSRDRLLYFLHKRIIEYFKFLCFDPVMPGYLIPYFIHSN